MVDSNPRRISALAAKAAVHRAFRWFHLHELQLRRWQMEFLAIPAPTFQEEKRAAWFVDQFRHLGPGQVGLDAEGNALAKLDGDCAGPEAVVLSAHLDTVFPSQISCIPTEDGPRILCPGACDNGAGLTALLGVAAALQYAELRPACPVILAANVGEEGEGDLRGMRHLIACPPFGLRPTAVIALEGAGSALVVDRALGSRRLRVTVKGAGGHSWVNANRPNPILALSAALLTVSRLPVPLQPRTVINVGTIKGGTSVNSVPETAVAQLDLRSTSEAELDRLEPIIFSTLSSQIAAENRGTRENERLHFTIERIGARPVGALAQDTELYASLRAVDRHLGISTDARIGSTDANLPLSQGVPALAMGAGGSAGGLHSTSEWYDPTGRELALRRILLLLLAACEVTAHKRVTTDSIGVLG